MNYEIIKQLDGNYYIMCHDVEKDIILNTLWLGKRFTSVELAKKWCEKSHDIEKLQNYCSSWIKMV